MSIKSKIQSLIAAANTATGESDATLTDAVQTLVDGYGQGGGGHTQFTFDKTITTNGGRDNAHAVVVGLLPYQTIEIVGYAYLVGATAVKYERLNYGLTSEQFISRFYLNTDGDTATQFRITGEFVNGAMKYVYSYPGKEDATATKKIMYNEFSFHWTSSISSTDTPIVIHATVTASY
jgi:hypothetical protein